MRAIIFAAALMVSPAALAQEPPARPDTPAPTSSASFEQREAWCEAYVSWFVASTPPPAQTAEAAPFDVEPGHRQDVEFNSCKLDPQEYERQTQAEAQLNAEADQG
jgi:hypothetical protein